MEYLALAALTLAGSWLALPLGRGPGIALAGRLGQGFLFGALLAGWIASWFERSGITAYALPLLAALSLAAVAAAVRELRRVRSGPHLHRTPVALALLGFFALALAHATLAVLEVGDRPPFPWDAWTNWLFRARAWFAEPGAPFAPMPGEGAAAMALQVPGAHYPAAIPALVAWLARCAGAWTPGRLLVAWPLAYLAAACAFAAFADHALRSRWTAVLAAAAVAATPLVVTHAMLAGYADLWLMGALVVCAAGAYELHRTRRLDARIALALLLPVLVKVEGLVWVVSMLVALAIAWRPLRIGAAVAALCVLGLGVMLAWPGGVHLFGERVVLSAELLRLPYLGQTPLQVNPILGPLLRATLGGETFGMASWGVLAAALAWFPLRGTRIARHGGERDAWRTLAVFALLALAFVLALFGFTPVGAWALDHTALSRVLMHPLPVFVLLAARVFEPLDPRADASQDPG